MTTLRKRKPNSKRGNRLSSMEFDEISVVTNPANQHSKIVLWKSNDRPTRTMDERTRELIAKRFAGLDIDSLPNDVQAAMDELVEDNVELAKAMVAAEEQRRELEDELDEAELDDVDITLTLPDEVELAKMEAFSEETWLMEDDILATIEARADEVLAREEAPTREQAIAKVLNDDPELWEKQRQVQLSKAERREAVQSDLVKSLTPTEQAMVESANAIATEQRRKSAEIRMGGPTMETVQTNAEAMAKAVQALRDNRLS